MKIDAAKQLKENVFIRRDECVVPTISFIYSSPFKRIAKLSSARAEGKTPIVTIGSMKTVKTFFLAFPALNSTAMNKKLKS